MPGHGSKFDRKHEAALEALLTQRSVQEAARVAGVGVQTLYRWLKDPDFEAAYREARSAAFGQAIARLQQGAGAAATTMLSMVYDKTVPAAVRLRAADLVLNHAQRGIEIEDLGLRVAALEQISKAREGTP